MRHAAPIYKTYGNLIAQKAYVPAGFELRLGLKDTRLALSAAEGHSVAMPLASLLRDQYLKAIARGYGQHDWAALAQVSVDDAG